VLLTALAAAASAQASAPASRPASIFDTAVALARRDHPSMDPRAVDKEIARMADLWRKRAGDAPSAEKSVEALRAVLFDDVKFEAVTTLDSPETLHVDSVLETRRGYCLSLSIVALAVAERAGIPLYGVALPNHFLVRYDDGRTRRNVELTRQGKEIPEAELAARTRGAPSDSVYLRNLTPAEVQAVLLHNRGFVALAAGRKDDARADLTGALERLPGLPEAHRNLGVLLGEDGKFAEARAEFDAALRLFPGDVEALVNRALCRQRLGDAVGAFADLDIALLLDPGRPKAVELRERVGRELREHDWSAWQRLAVAPLDRPPAPLEPGLDVRFFAGVNFDKEAARRVDREIDFDWKRSAPDRGVPADRFSTRAEGWFRAVKDGKYTFFVVSNDGARLALDERVWLENWADVGYENWYGTVDVPLVAGWHRIRLEHFEARGGARLLLRIGVDGEEKTLKQSDCLFRDAAKAK
jgi:regulator of sirC expression with transglutaminase-like and TPR domain